MSFSWDSIPPCRKCGVKLRVGNTGRSSHVEGLCAACLGGETTPVGVVQSPFGTIVVLDNGRAVKLCIEAGVHVWDELPPIPGTRAW